MPPFKIDIPRILGNKRRAEPNDDPPHFSKYLLNGREFQEGEFSRRGGIAAEYADRPTTYEHTTPLSGRGIDVTDNVFYNSWKRKTIAVATKNGVHYTFQGVIDCGDKWQRLRIYRTSLLSDNLSFGVDHHSDTGYRSIWHDTYASLAAYRAYQPHYSEPHCAFIDYSMIYDAAREVLIVAMVLRDDHNAPLLRSVVRVVEISGLFEANWGGDGASAAPSQVWTLVDNELEDINDATGDFCTHDVDIEQGSDGTVFVVYGFYDVSNLKFIFREKRNLCTAGVWGVWSAATSILSSVDNAHYYGAVLQYMNGYIYLGFVCIEKASSPWDWTIRRYSCEDDLAGTWSAPDDVAVISSFYKGEDPFDDAELSLFGPAMMVDIDNTLVIAYRTSLGEVYVMAVGVSNFTALRATDEVTSANRWLMPVGLVSIHPPDGELFGVLSNWNIAVKDGVLFLYYGTYNRGCGIYQLAPQDRRYFQIKRKALIFDDDDQEYNNMAFFDPEIVEEHLSGQSFLNTHSRYEADALKRLSFTRWEPYDPGMEGDTEFTDSSTLNYIQQDRGVFEGAVELEQMSVIRYGARQPVDKPNEEVQGDLNTTALERITVVQCDDHRFYVRRNGMWRLLEGQTDESNSFIKNNCRVDGRAFFFTKLSALRAGCGTGINSGAMIEETSPIHYDLIDRRIYFNDDPNNEVPHKPYRLRARRLEFDQPKEAPAGVTVEADVITDRYEATFGVRVNWDDTCEPLETDTNNVNEHYARFSPTIGTSKTEDVDKGSGNVSTLLLIGEDDSNPNYYAAAQQPYSDWRQDPPPRVEHPYKTINANVKIGADNYDVFLKQPYIEVFLGYAIKYDDGSISQIVPVWDEPYKLGFEIYGLGDNNNFTDYSGRLDALGNVQYPRQYWRMLKVTTRITRWNWNDPQAMNRRMVSIMFFWGLRDTPGTDAWNATYRLVKEVLIAKTDEFHDREWEGDKEWTVITPVMEPGATGSQVKMITYLDHKCYEKTFRMAENAVAMLGHGTPVLQKVERRSYLDGYKYAGIVGDRIFFGAVKMNGEVNETDLRWTGFGMMGGEGFPTLGVVGIENLRRLKFGIQNVSPLGEETIVAFGDNDIEWGRVLRNIENWEFRGTLQDLGTTSPRSIAKIAEMAETGKFNGLSFISSQSGLRFFDLYSSRVLTSNINEDYNDLRNPAGTRTHATRPGAVSQIDDQAMVIHLPDYRLILIHFPTTGVTIVRDLKAESYDRGGGDFWMQWTFGKNPKAWCCAPEGHLLFTNGDELYRWPGEDVNGNPCVDDDGVAIAFEGRISDIPLPTRSEGLPSKLVVDYDLQADYFKVNITDPTTYPTLIVDVIKDDGQRLDLSSIIARTGWFTEYPHSARTRSSRCLGGLTPGRAKQSLSLAWRVTNPLNIVICRLYGFSIEAEVFREN